MGKYGIYVILAVIIVISGLWYVQNTGRPKPGNTQSVSQESVPDEYEPAYTETQFEDKSSVDTTIDAELDEIEAELNAVSDTDFDDAGLSDTELGL